jgi:DNA-binding response OmpR family regulator
MDVLIADDDPVNSRLLEACLKKWGHRVVICSDGNAAWEVLKDASTPKLAILDWMMPGIEGPELCRKVRALEHGRLLHIILLTSRNAHNDIVGGLGAGANDYVIKPFAPGELQARVGVGLRVLALQDRLIQAERYRILTETAGAVAHEINQPLTILLGHLEFLELKFDPEDPVRTALDKVTAAGHRIAGIVKNMQAIRKVVTTPYIEGIELIDFEKSSEGSSEA